MSNEPEIESPPEPPAMAEQTEDEIDPAILERLKTELLGEENDPA